MSNINSTLRKNPANPRYFTDDSQEVKPIVDDNTNGDDC